MRSSIVLSLIVTLCSAATAWGQAPSLATGQRVEVTTVDRAVLVGTIEAVSDESVELLVVSGRSEPPRRVTVPMQDIDRIASSRGPGPVAWRVKRAALGAAIIGGVVSGVWGATIYDDADLNYASPAEGLLYGALGGGLVFGAMGGLVAAFTPIERWDTIAPATYRGTTAPRRPTVPHYYVSARGGLNGQSRLDRSDPPELLLDGARGRSAGWGWSLGTRTSERGRLEFDAWLPAFVHPDIAVAPGDERRAFRDYAYSFVGIREFRPLRARVRPECHLGLTFVRVQERQLSSRRSASGVLVGGGAQIRVSRHLFVAPEVRATASFDSLTLGCAFDCSWRWSLRPSVAAAVAF